MPGLAVMYRSGHGSTRFYGLAVVTQLRGDVRGSCRWDQLADPL